MSQAVRIPTQLYDRLAEHAKGFDSPANVIKRLLNYYEDHENIVSTRSMKPEHSPSNNLEILLYPEDEKKFKELLLVNKKAFVRLYKTDEHHETKEWIASRFSETSNLIGNLRSGPLRGWKEKGIYKTVIAINREDIH